MGSSVAARIVVLYCVAVVFAILVSHGGLARAHSAQQQGSRVVGSGYQLVSIQDLKGGDGVVAILEVIKETPKILGQDIKRLKLVAR